MIGKRLQLARRAAGLSLRDLEAEFDELVSAQAFSKHERDEMLPGSDVVAALARAPGTGDPRVLGPILVPCCLPRHHISEAKAAEFLGINVRQQGRRLETSG